MDAALASKPLSEELYILTGWGKDCETDFYYDKYGNIKSRKEVVKTSKRKLPNDYIPAYGLGYLFRKLPTDTTPEDLLVRLCIELAKNNLFYT